MATITDANEQFALSVSKPGTVVWTLQLQETVATPQPNGSATNDQNFDYEGIITSAGISAIGLPGVDGFTLEMTYLSALNTGTGTQTFSCGKRVLGIYFQFSPTMTLTAGESAIYVAGAGWTVYTAAGIPKK